MKAIKTKYLGPTDYKGARISATDTWGHRVIVPYDYGAARDGAHDRAALALCEKMGWHGTLVRGGMKDCYVYVFDCKTEKITT